MRRIFSSVRMWASLCWLGLAQAGFAQAVQGDEWQFHLLNRIAYGASAYELGRIDQIGLENYRQEQLFPERISLPSTLQNQLNGLTTTKLTPGALWQNYQSREGSARREWLEQVSRENHTYRYVRASQSPRQLEEVLTEFWFNHFNVFEQKGLVRLWVGDFERQAIRPFVLGRFRDLLGAVAHHPAMLVYLDNWRNRADTEARRGINENYARELLELHTVGREAGYSQEDVQNLAAIFSGWSIDFTGMQQGSNAQGFIFQTPYHSRGNKTVLGQHFSSHDAAEGEAALDFLAHHPATAQHIARQLAQFFISENPPVAVVNTLSQRFLATDGDLRAVMQTLLEHPAFRERTVVGSLFKTPYQFTLSALRATQTLVQNPQPLDRQLHRLGMPLYGQPTPDGYSYAQRTWLNPEAVLQRIQWAILMGNGNSGANNATGRPNTTAVSASVWQQLSHNSRTVVNAVLPRSRNAFMLASPEFMYH